MAIRRLWRVRRPEPGSGLILGGPDQRRVRFFRQALHRAGLPEATVLSYHDALDGRWPDGVHDAAWLRIETPGEDLAVRQRLAASGGGEAAPHAVPGRLLPHAPVVAGLRRVWEALDARLPPTIVRLQRPDQLLEMIDKVACHRTLSRAEVAVPPAFPLAAGRWDVLERRMTEKTWPRVFVKPRFGSSGAGVMALQTARGQWLAHTSATPTADGVCNSLRPHAERDPATIAGVLYPAVDRDGVLVERWLPKATLHGRTLDLRVVTDAGEPTHAVVRTARGPITNLHLGNARGDLAVVRERLDDAWDELLDLCRAAAACFAGCLSVGIDVHVGTDWRSLHVLEVNAFGDLLPRLVDGHGRTTYDAQAEWLAGTERPPRCHACVTDESLPVTP